jgi:coenzyme F420-reducing hydrogenase beta subunit
MKIYCDERYRGVTFSALKKYAHLIDEIENMNMDDGRFFVHLKEGLNYPVPYEDCTSKSFGNQREAARMLREIDKQHKQRG